VRSLELQYVHGDGAANSDYSIQRLCIVQRSHPNPSSVSKVLDRLKNYSSTLHQRSNLLYKFLQINFNLTNQGTYTSKTIILLRSLPKLISSGGSNSPVFLFPVSTSDKSANESSGDVVGVDDSMPMGKSG